MEEYLQASEVIDWQHPKIMKRAKQIAFGMIYCDRRRVRMRQSAIAN